MLDSAWFDHLGPNRGPFPGVWSIVNNPPTPLSIPILAREVISGLLHDSDPSRACALHKTLLERCPWAIKTLPRSLFYTFRTSVEVFMSMKKMRPGLLFMRTGRSQTCFLCAKFLYLAD